MAKGVQMQVTVTQKKMGTDEMVYAHYRIV